MSELFNEALSTMGGGQIILIPHLLVFTVALNIWLKRDIKWNFGSVLFDVLGAISTLIVFFLSIFLLFDRMSSAGTGSLGTWYVIYGIVTLGVVPLFLLWIYYLSGRLIGRLVQLLRLRKSRHTFGRPESAAG